MVARTEAKEPTDDVASFRTLLLTAADAAREGRRTPEIAGRIQPDGRAIRDRISMLISAAG